MARNDHKQGLERLGVLIGRTRSREVREKTFKILGAAPPRMPEAMIETQPLEIIPVSSMILG